MVEWFQNERKPVKDIFLLVQMCVCVLNTFKRLQNYLKMVHLKINNWEHPVPNHQEAPALPTSRENTLRFYMELWRANLPLTKTSLILIAILSK